jgi:hypothetical protein
MGLAIQSQWFTWTEFDAVIFVTSCWGDKVARALNCVPQAIREFLELDVVFHEHKDRAFVLAQIEDGLDAIGHAVMIHPCLSVVFRDHLPW